MIDGPKMQSHTHTHHVCVYMTGETLGTLRPGYPWVTHNRVELDVGCVQGESALEKSVHKRYSGVLEKDSDNINYCLFCWLPHRSTDFFVRPVIFANTSRQARV